MTTSVKSIYIKGSLLNNDGVTDKESEDALLDEDECKMRYPTLVEPNARDDVYVDMAYESSPSAALSQRLVLKSKPLRLVYDALTVNNVIYFFRSVESKSKLATAAFRTITRVKDRSLQYMRNNLQNIQRIDLDISIEPSLLLVPENGKFSKCVRFI